MKNIIGILVGLLIIAGPHGRAEAVEIDDYPALQELVRTMVANDGFTENELRSILAGASIDQKTLALMDRQYESLPWYKYRNLFINDERIARGVDFWKTYEGLLARAEQEYGVSQQVIVALIGVETHYGTRIGDKSVLDSLVTLSAAYPRRSEFFSSELRTFLNMTRKEGIEPASVVGSFAGAIGIPQFMPSSYEAYSVDFNGNNQRDLVNETADAIGSVANYLKVHGWRAGKPIYAPIPRMPESGLPLVTKRAKPKLSIADIQSAGISFDATGASDKAAVLRLTEETKKRYFVGYRNFYAITRYNPSVNYAMAVTELSEAIRERAGQP